MTLPSPLTIPECVFTDSKRIIDTHAHYNLEPLYQQWPQLWAKAQELGVQHTVIASTTLESSRRAVEIAQADPNLWALVGVHPSEISENLAERVDQGAYLRELGALLDQEKVLGVGEIGLDYYWLKAEERAAQSVIHRTGSRAAGFSPPAWRVVSSAHPG